MGRYSLLYFSIVMLLLLQACAPPAQQEEPERERFAGKKRYEVSRVVDGDTIEVVMEGRRVKVRLIGVDTPETVDPRKPVEYFGREASAFTKQLLEGQQVWLVDDPQGDTIDKYGRKLAHVYRAPDGLWVNLELIRQGYGFAYTVFPFKYMEEFRAAEREAREARRGLWGDGTDGKNGIDGKDGGEGAAAGEEQGRTRTLALTAPGTDGHGQAGTKAGITDNR